MIRRREAGHLDASKTKSNMTHQSFFQTNYMYMLISNNWCTRRVFADFVDSRWCDDKESGYPENK